MTWEELINWIEKTSRTPEDLQAACRGLGLPDYGNRTQMRSRLRTYINDQPNLRAYARWQPSGVTPTPASSPTPQWSNLVYYAALAGLIIVSIVLGIVLTRWALVGESLKIPMEFVFEPAKAHVDVEVEGKIATRTTPTPTPVPPTPTPVPPTPAIVTPVALASANADFKWGWGVEWYRSPFRETTDLLDDPLTHETLAEPGVFPGMEDTQTAWDRMEGEETYMLVPEAGYLYFATGGYCLWLVSEDSHNPLGCTPAGEERIYLTVVRGLPSDGGDADLNQRVVATNYVRATGIYHSLPAGAYVSLGWMLQQIDNAFEPMVGIEDPNCGDNGCDLVYVVVIDLQTKTTRVWLVGPGLRDWSRVSGF